MKLNSDELTKKASVEWNSGEVTRNTLKWRLKWGTSPTSVKWNFCEVTFCHQPYCWKFCALCFLILPVQSRPVWSWDVPLLRPTVFSSCCVDAYVFICFYCFICLIPVSFSCSYFFFFNYTVYFQMFFCGFISTPIFTAKKCHQSLSSKWGQQDTWQNL